MGMKKKKKRNYGFAKINPSNEKTTIHIVVIETW